MTKPVKSVVIYARVGTSKYMIEKHYSHLIPTMAADELAGKYFGKRKEQSNN